MFRRGPDIDPIDLPVYRNARLRLIKTIDFDHGLVNGLEAEVVGIGPHGCDLRLPAGDVVSVWQTTRALTGPGRRRHRMAFELELAYATTVHQAEGQSLDQVCIVFESFAPPGWAYTALTRARSMQGLRVIGRPETKHFKPRQL